MKGIWPLRNLGQRCITSFKDVRGRTSLVVKGSGLLVPSLNQGQLFFLLPQRPPSTNPIISGKLVLEQKPD